jgi:M6 family metalloprotease-like protein
MSARLFTICVMFVALAMTMNVSAIDLSKGILLDIPDDVASRQFGKMPPSALTPDELEAIASFRFLADTLRLLVVPVEWNNRPHTWPVATIDSMLFSRNEYPGGSMADYFHEVSYGKAVVVGDVLDWYNAGTYTSYFDFEDILPAIDAMVDFSQYDGNDDGDVDAVIFLRAGTGEEDSQNPEDIWSYAFVYGPNGGPGPYDGKYISHWNTSPELFPLRYPEFPSVFTGEDTLNHIRVFCHETTHNFGLPDLYDYDAKLNETTYYTPADSNDHPMVDWCLMGYYGYGYLSLGCVKPSHLCGWNKAQIDWIEPIDLYGTHENLVIYDIETHSDSSLYRITIDYAEGEYFLLEFRNPHSSGLFDKLDSDFSVKFWPDLTYGGDTLDCGLMITHVHDSLGAYYWRINYGLPDYPHYTVAVEDAGYNPSMDEYSNPEGHVTDSAQWWYPWETRRAALFSDDVSGQNEFSPTTYPSSDGYYGPSGVIVRVDSIVGDKLYAYVYAPFTDADGDGVADPADNCVNTYNPGQEDDDMDQIGNACDNCPYVGNPDQEDIDGDGIGRVCDDCVDTDDDGYGNPGYGNVCPDDNCPDVYNPLQEDSNGDGIGDSCNYRMREWDSVSTTCLRLMVGSNGDIGHNAGGANMDFSWSGDCDPSADIYVFDGSPLLIYDNGTGYVSYYSMYFNMPSSPDPFVLVTEGNWPVPTQTTTDYDIYESGTFVTPDSFIAMEKTWWAPKNPDSCEFIIQRLRVYSYDGQLHSGVAISEAVDWDIPSDAGSLNFGGYDALERLLYIRGMETNGTGCQPNDHRYGGMAVIGYHGNDSTMIDSAFAPHSAYVIDNETYMFPYEGWDPDVINALIQNPGFGVYNSPADMSMIMTYFYDYTVAVGDTISVYTVLTSVQNDPSASGDKAANQLAANVHMAKQWTNDHVISLSSPVLCGDANGDGTVNVGDAVYLINYIFKGGPAPDPLCSGDANGDGVVNIADAVYLINYIFKGGLPPVVPCCP